MSLFLVAWSHPEGSDYSLVEAEDRLDACRQLRFLLERFSVGLRILSVEEARS